MNGNAEMMVCRPKVVLASTCYRFRGIAIDANNKGALVGAGKVAVGTIQGAVFRNASNESAYAADAEITLEPCHGEQLMEASEAWDPGDYLKWGANGKLACEADVTARTANTVAVARETASADGDIRLVFFLHG